jgi:hypothetical protein
MQEDKGRKVVLMGELAYTNSKSNSPVLCTFGCGPCVGGAIYSPCTGQIAVFHFDNGRRWEASKIEHFLKSQEHESLIVHLVSEESIGDTDPNGLYVTILRFLSGLSFKPEIHLYKQDSIMMDARTGAVSTYDPSLYPNDRKINECDHILALMGCFNGTAILSYLEPSMRTVVKLPCEVGIPLGQEPYDSPGENLFSKEYPNHFDRHIYTPIRPFSRKATHYDLFGSPPLSRRDRKKRM